MDGMAGIQIVRESQYLYIALLFARAQRNAYCQNCEEISLHFNWQISSTFMSV